MLNDGSVDFFRMCFREQPEVGGTKILYILSYTIFVEFCEQECFLERLACLSGAAFQVEIVNGVLEASLSQIFLDALSERSLEVVEKEVRGLGFIDEGGVDCPNEHF